MYAVVGCTQCGAYWLLTDPQASDSATCPTCGRRHQTKKLNRFFESEDREAAREARAALLAKKHGDSEAFADVAHVSELENLVEESGMSEREYLEQSGLDADEVQAAGDTTREQSRSRDEKVRDAVREGGTEAEVLERAVEDGVPRGAAEKLLEKLRRQGEVIQSGGELRLV
jgi:DNA-directed RNA polymerase subunit RPC12/RpoP